jgi:hypothetical protein
MVDRGCQHFHETANEQKGRESKKKKKKLIINKKNFQILDESQKAMYSVNVVS